MAIYDDLVSYWPLASASAIVPLADSGAGALMVDNEGLWHFDNNPNDTSGNAHNLTPVNVPTYVAGKVGTHAADCHAASSQYFHVDLAGDAPTTDGTLACWFNLDSTAQHTKIMALGTTAVTGTGLWRAINIEPAGQLAFAGYGADITGITPLVTGRWYHVAVTWASTDNVVVYLDGVAVATATLGALNTPSSVLAFGAQTAGATHYADYKVDEAAVWSRALSAVEVANIYALQRGNIAVDAWGINHGIDTDVVYSGGIADYNGSTAVTEIGTPASLDMGTSDFTCAAWFKTDTLPPSGGVLTRGLTSTGGASPSTAGYGLRFDGSSQPRFSVADGPGAGLFDITSASAVGTGVWYHVAGVREATAIVPFPDSGAATPIDMTDNEGLWHFDNNANDTSGNAHNLTAYNAPTYVTGKVGTHAAQFDGVNQYFDVDLAADAPGANGTISCWFKINGTLTGGDVICGLGTTVASSVGEWRAIAVYPGGGSGVAQLAFFGKGADIFGSVGSPTLTFGVWYHAVLTWSGTSVIMYLDGVAVPLLTGTVGALITPETTFAVAGRTDAGSYFTPCDVDEAAIWSRVLSAVEVANIYALQSGNRAKLYVNGVLAASTTTGIARNINTNMPLSIGASTYVSIPDAYFFNGAINDAAIWERALTTAEITAIHAAGVGGLGAMLVTSQLRGLWATVVHDGPVISKLAGLWSSVVHDGPPDPTAIVPDIAGTVLVPATFDGSGSLSPSHYHWVWVSVPATSSITIGPTPFPDNLAPDPIDMTGNVALYHFDNSPNDSSSLSNNLTPVGVPTYVAGKVGTHAADLNGTSQYFHADLAGDAPTTDGTIACWFRLDGSNPTPVNQPIIGLGPTAVVGTGLWRSLKTNPAGFLAFAGYGADILSAAAIVANQWYHVVLTWAATDDVVVYLNGFAVATQTLAALETPSSVLSIGAQTIGASRYADCQVDEAAVWTRVLSATEIADIWRAQVSAFAPIAFPDAGATEPINMTDNVALYHMEGGGTDSSGEGNNLTAVNGPTYVVGKVGAQSADCNGTNQYFHVDLAGDAPVATGTMSAWVYFDSTLVNPTILGLGPTDVSGNGRWRSLNINPANKLAFSGYITDITDIAPIVTNQWYHVAFSWDAANEVAVYLDGVEVARQVVAGLTLVGLSTVLSIGGRTQAGSYYANYKIDEVAVWTRVLSATEVANIHALQTGNYVGVESTYTFTPDVVGTYTINLEVDPTSNTDADAVIAAAPPPGAPTAQGSAMQGSTLQGGGPQGSN